MTAAGTGRLVRLSATARATIESLRPELSQRASGHAGLESVLLTGLLPTEGKLRMPPGYSMERLQPEGRLVWWCALDATRHGPGDRFHILASKSPERPYVGAADAGSGQVRDLVAQVSSSSRMDRRVAIVSVLAALGRQLPQGLVRRLATTALKPEVAWCLALHDRLVPDERFTWADTFLGVPGRFPVTSDTEPVCTVFSDVVLASYVLIDTLLATPSPADGEAAGDESDAHGRVVLDLREPGHVVTANGEELRYGPPNGGRGGRITVRHRGLRLLHALHRDRRPPDARSDSVSDLNAALVGAGAGDLRVARRSGSYVIEGAVSFTEALLRAMGERIRRKT